MMRPASGVNTRTAVAAEVSDEFMSVMSATSIAVPSRAQALRARLREGMARHHAVAHHRDRAALGLQVGNSVRCRRAGLR